LEQSFAAYKQTVPNQAYTFVLVAIEEIRRCAAHAFWNDKKHLKGYQSEYFRKTGM
jgi:mRNA deadenylase 3'-5' endonuclease subunit Ccr4